MIHSTQESPNPKKELKILILGHVQSGKTSILSTYLNSSFKDEYNSTIGISYYSRIISFNKNPVKLNIWDFSGRDKFRELNTIYMNSHAAIVVYDKTCFESFERVRRFINTFREQNEEDPVVLVVGNKLDLVSSVSSEQGMDLASSLGALFMEVSGKTGENIEFCFDTVVRACLN